MSQTKQAFEQVLFGRGNGLGNVTPLTKKEKAEFQAERERIFREATATEYFIGQLVNADYGVCKIVDKQKERGIWMYSLEPTDAKTVKFWKQRGQSLPREGCRGIYGLVTK